jgi:hypothetical protein
VYFRCLVSNVVEKIVLSSIVSVEKAKESLGGSKSAG